jgi:hypothetical protein
MRKTTQLTLGGIAASIHVLRGQKVMLDTSLATLYEVETRILVQAVKRNAERFPADFCFQLTPVEAASLKSQVSSSSGNWGGRRSAPYAFTEQGVAMLSSVLRSDRAIAVNIEIMRVFVRLRQVLAANDELAKQLTALESRIDKRLTEHDKAIVEIMRAIRALVAPPTESKRKIGFV